MIRISRPASLTGYVKVFALCVLALTANAGGQAPFRELPIERIEKPRERSKNDSLRVKAPVNQPPSTAQLAVLLDPIVRGQVYIKDPAGRIIRHMEADSDGQAIFTLPRGQTYSIEAEYPGYSGERIISKLSKSQIVARYKLTAESRSLRLPTLPPDAEVFIDDSPVELSSISGVPTIADVPEGRHTLKIRHPEYSEFIAPIDFSGIAVGESSTVFIRLEKTARVTLLSTPGANVFLDGELKGQMPEDGRLRFDVPVQEPAEHLILIEMLGYEPRTVRKILAPGENSIESMLEPVVTSDGTSDFFDDLTHWAAPETWEILREGNNRRLRISGSATGWMRGKIYRDLLINFALWMPDGRGATWAVRADEKGRNYYLFHLSGPNSTTHIPNRFYTYIVRDGGRPEQVDTPTPVLDTPDDKTSYTVEISIRGHKIEHTMESNETGERTTLGSFTDSSLTRDERAFGTFGFLSLAGETFIVDDLHLDPIKEIAEDNRNSEIKRIFRKS
ncbi:MAG: carboxypeptidase regulatory-like domain-containing protein [Acidobacteria bacterium]|nr:carboxypeptidase regulatory-like domain-containing protein [Acidobacteriota bacterium]